MGAVHLLALLDDGPVLLKIVSLIVVLLGLLLDERASAIEFPIDCLDRDLRAIVLQSVSPTTRTAWLRLVLTFLIF